MEMGWGVAGVLVCNLLRPSYVGEIWAASGNNGNEIVAVGVNS